MTMCGSWWCVGVRTLSLSALVEGQHDLHSHRVLTISVPCTPSPVWLKCRCVQHPPRLTLERHLGGFGVQVLGGYSSTVRELPRGQYAWHPGRTGISVGYYGEPDVLCDHGDSGSLYSFSTSGYPACYQCGVALAQCGGIGSPGAVVSLYQVTLLAFSSPVAPRLPLVAW